MSDIDPDATRHAIAQVIQRSPLADEATAAASTDHEVVSEIYNLLGLNRLVLHEPSVPYFMAAIKSHREHRKRTLFAWDAIRAFVKTGVTVPFGDTTSGDATVEAAVSVDGSASSVATSAASSSSSSLPMVTPSLLNAMNASLTEYDLPLQMTDDAVLAELLSLLDIPRYKLSFAIERLLLKAIRRHRDDRFVNTLRQLHLTLAKMVAAARNDTDAVGESGAPLLSMDEIWSIEAINATVTQLMGDALQIMDPSPDAPDLQVWEKLLMHMGLGQQRELDATARLPVPINPLAAAAKAAKAKAAAAAKAAAMTSSAGASSAAMAEHLARSGGGESATVLRVAFRRVRMRRAAEARVQTSFEELIAIVKAEDPALAEEEQKKRKDQERYERRKAKWLLRLIARAAELNVDGAQEVLTIEREIAIMAKNAPAGTTPVIDPRVQLRSTSSAAEGRGRCLGRRRRRRPAQRESGRGREEGGDGGWRGGGGAAASTAAAAAAAAALVVERGGGGGYGGRRW